MEESSATQGVPLGRNQKEKRLRIEKASNESENTISELRPSSEKMCSGLQPSVDIQYEAFMHMDDKQLYSTICGHSFCIECYYQIPVMMPSAKITRKLQSSGMGHIIVEPCRLCPKVVQGERCGMPMPRNAMLLQNEMHYTNVLGGDEINRASQLRTKIKKIYDVILLEQKIEYGQEEDDSTQPDDYPLCTGEEFDALIVDMKAENKKAIPPTGTVIREILMKRFVNAGNTNPMVQLDRRSGSFYVVFDNFKFVFLNPPLPHEVDGVLSFVQPLKTYDYIAFNTGYKMVQHTNAQNKFQLIQADQTTPANLDNGFADQYFLPDAGRRTEQTVKMLLLYSLMLQQWLVACKKEKINERMHIALRSIVNHVLDDKQQGSPMYNRMVDELCAWVRDYIQLTLRELAYMPYQADISSVQINYKLQTKTSINRKYITEVLDAVLRALEEKGKRDVPDPALSNVDQLDKQLTRMRLQDDGRFFKFYRKYLPNGISFRYINPKSESLIDKARFFGSMQRNWIYMEGQSGETIKLLARYLYHSSNIYLKILHQSDNPDASMVNFLSPLHCNPLSPTDIDLTVRKVSQQHDAHNLKIMKGVTTGSILNTFLNSLCKEKNVHPYLVVTPHIGKRSMLISFRLANQTTDCIWNDMEPMQCGDDVVEYLKDDPKTLFGTDTVKIAFRNCPKQLTGSDKIHQRFLACLSDGKSQLLTIPQIQTEIETSAGNILHMDNQVRAQTEPEVESRSQSNAPVEDYGEAVKPKIQRQTFNTENLPLSVVIFRDNIMLHVHIGIQYQTQQTSANAYIGSIMMEPID